MSTSKPGRPRSAETRQRLLDAAFKLMSDRGYEGLTFEGVAQAASAGKTTIYRWWATKAELAVDAFFETTKQDLGFPDTGSAREDFRLQIIELAGLLQDRRGAVFAAMLGGARTDPALAAALGKRWLEPRRQWGYQRMLRAEAEGQLRPGTDIGAALGLLYGPLYTPLLFGQPSLSGVRLAAHLDLALGAVFG
jgi:AcrR family transcriptional regulator